mmetsp:Transcript_8550/g.31618  ORF Transcript_8550/g.31618 Transcript_8550/m.31618 type:complete len:278 (-) Transcript_8550:6686-7519(-)
MSWSRHLVQVKCLSHELLGPNYKEATLELNASDERGLETVREKIKQFAQTKVTLPPGRHKIIILDEADSMTKASQQALRRIMELYSKTTRFALACNNSSKIIEPIQSRCAIVRYNRLQEDEIYTRLVQVIEQEGIEKNDEGIAALIYTADGDLRNALNNLQATVQGFGKLSQDNVFKVCDQPHPSVIDEIIEACVEGKLKEALLKLSNMYSVQGYSPQDIIGTMSKELRSNTVKMTEFQQLQCIREVGQTHMRLVDGVETHLQLCGMVARLCRICRR